MVALHNGALENRDVSNQLLNLWTAIEVLIDTKRDNEDKINTICSILCSILNRSYIYSQLEQLLSDMKACAKSDVVAILLRILPEQSELDFIERLVIILSVDKYEKELSELIEAVSEYPLIKYRIELFSNHIFKDSQSICTYLKRHEQRVRWHIMRIYRNRNMIVHSGSYMPYRNMIVENLHFYVDVLLDTLIEYYHVGLLNHTSIYQNIISEETEHLIKLGVPIKNKNQKSDSIIFTDENALALILNNYSGSFIKKAIDKAISGKAIDAKPQERVLLTALE